MESEINEIENISIINENGDEIIDTKTSLTYKFETFINSPTIHLSALEVIKRENSEIKKIFSIILITHKIKNDWDSISQNLNINQIVTLITENVEKTAKRLTTDASADCLSSLIFQNPDTFKDFHKIVENSKKLNTWELFFSTLEKVLKLTKNNQIISDLKFNNLAKYITENISGIFISPLRKMEHYLKLSPKSKQISNMYISIISIILIDPIMTENFIKNSQNLIIILNISSVIILSLNNAPKSVIMKFLADIIHKSLEITEIESTISEYLKKSDFLPNILRVLKSIMDEDFRIEVSDLLSFTAEMDIDAKSFLEISLQLTFSYNPIISLKNSLAFLDFTRCVVDRNHEIIQANFDLFVEIYFRFHINAVKCQNLIMNKIIKDKKNSLENIENCKINIRKISSLLFNDKHGNALDIIMDYFKQLVNAYLMAENTNEDISGYTNCLVEILSECKLKENYEIELSENYGIAEKLIITSIKSPIKSIISCYSFVEISHFTIQFLDYFQNLWNAYLKQLNSHVKKIIEVSVECSSTDSDTLKWLQKINKPLISLVRMVHNKIKKHPDYNDLVQELFRIVFLLTFDLCSYDWFQKNYFYFHIELSCTINKFPITIDDKLLYYMEYTMKLFTKKSFLSSFDDLGVFTNTYGLDGALSSLGIIENFKMLNQFISITYLTFASTNKSTESHMKFSSEPKNSSYMLVLCRMLLKIWQCFVNSLNFEVNKNASEPLRESVEIFNTSIFDFSPTDPIEFDNLTQRIYLLGKNLIESISEAFNFCGGNVEEYRSFSVRNLRKKFIIPSLKLPFFLLQDYMNIFYKNYILKGSMYSGCLTNSLSYFYFISDFYTNIISKGNDIINELKKTKPPKDYSEKLEAKFDLLIYSTDILTNLLNEILKKYKDYLLKETGILKEDEIKKIGYKKAIDLIPKLQNKIIKINFECVFYFMAISSENSVSKFCKYYNIFFNFMKKTHDRNSKDIVFDYLYILALKSIITAAKTHSTSPSCVVNLMDTLIPIIVMANEGTLLEFKNLVTDPSSPAFDDFIKKIKSNDVSNDDKKDDILKMVLGLKQNGSNGEKIVSNLEKSMIIDDISRKISENSTEKHITEMDLIQIKYISQIC